jgi:DNA-binding winged helix-turn-helix (wHTH) protein
MEKFWDFSGIFLGRANPSMEDRPILHFGPYQLDPSNARLWRETQPVRLTPKAFQVLCHVVERPGQLVTKEELFQAVWADTVISDATLTSAIQEIRKALQDTPKNPQYLETVPKRGFRFIGEVVSSQQEESQKANGKNIEQAEGLKLEAVRLPSFSPSSLEPTAYSPSQDSVLSTQHSPPSRFTRGVMLAAVLLLTATVLIVQYLSRPTLSTQDSALSTDAAPAALPLPNKPSIIVLPFVNLSGDAEQEYFSDGITDYLITNLSRVLSLFVIARTSAFTYKGKAVKVQDVGREMGVRYVL